MICLIISNMQHQDSLHFIFLAIKKFVMKCESWFDAEIAQLQSIVTLHTPFPGLQSSVSQFMKAEQSNLMILSIAEHLNIFCKVDYLESSERKNKKVEWKTFESILNQNQHFISCCQCLASQYIALGPESKGLVLSSAPDGSEHDALSDSK